MCIRDRYQKAGEEYTADAFESFPEFVVLGIVLRKRRLLDFVGGPGIENEPAGSPVFKIGRLFELLQRTIDVGIAVPAVEISLQVFPVSSIGPRAINVGLDRHVQQAPQGECDGENQPDALPAVEMFHCEKLG